MIGRTKGFILEPATDYERNGLVPNVTFPSGAVLVKDEIWVYYGAADTVVGLATGKTAVALDYVRPWEKDIKPVQSTNFVVIVKAKKAKGS